MKKFLLIIVVLAAAAGLGVYFYLDYKNEQEMLYPKFYSSNGRLEAVELYVSSRFAGRIEKIFVKEGDLVRKGDKLVQMQTAPLLAQKAAVTAKLRVKEGELAMAKAVVQEKQNDFAWAEKDFKRYSDLLKTKATSLQAYDKSEKQYKNTLAALEYAKANVIACEGSIAEQKAELQKIEVDINDSLLVATYDGRIQYLLAREGEVLAAGGRVMNLVNLTDAYMTFFFPTKIAGQVQIGAEVKLIFDAAPDNPFDATVTYIDPVAQFTPKSVETKVEREKLMFRLKANLNAALLNKYIAEVKTGLPGVAWVKLDPKADWKEAPAAVLQK